MTFDSLYKECYPQFLAFVKKKSIPQSDAEDIVQEAFISVWKGGKLDLESRCKPYFFRLLNWRAKDWAKRNATHNKVFVSMSEDGTLENLYAYEPEKISPERKEIISRSIRTLKEKSSPKNFNIFSAYISGRESAEETAQKFEIPVDNVYLSRHRSLKKIAKLAQQFND